LEVQLATVAKMLFCSCTCNCITTFFHKERRFEPMKEVQPCNDFAPVSMLFQLDFESVWLV
jgi:hypothetical protein